MQPGRRNASAPEGTSYGMVLLAKTAALVALVAIGGWHRRTTLPLLAAQRCFSDWSAWRCSSSP